MPTKPHRALAAGPAPLQGRKPKAARSPWKDTSPPPAAAGRARGGPRVRAASGWHDALAVLQRGGGAGGRSAALAALLALALTAAPATAQSPAPPAQPTRPPAATPATPRAATPTPRPAQPTPTPAAPTATPTPAGPLVFVPLRIPSSEQASGPTGTVSGRVVDLAGRPLGGVVVRLWVEQFSVLATTAMDGSYVFAGLAPGTYQLALQDQRSQIAVVSLAAGEVVALNFVQRVAAPGAPAPAPVAPPAVPDTPTPAVRATGTPSPTATAVGSPSPTPSPRPTSTLPPLPTLAPVVVSVPTSVSAAPARPQPRTAPPLDVLARSIPWGDLVAPLVFGGLAGGVLVGLLALASLRRR